MLWNILDRVVNLAFLLLASVLIYVLIQNGQQSNASTNFSESLELHKKQVGKTIESNNAYFEERLGRIAASQDEYQSSTHGKLSVLERRIENIEKNGANNKNSVIVNNTNNISPFVSPKQE